MRRNASKSTRTSSRVRPCVHTENDNLRVLNVTKARQHGVFVRLKGGATWPRLC